ncbi:MAG: hypothetical protein JO285_10535 [Kutzneria sp.]|nr:hypothetical protein [Kutzneria sp.]
MGTVAAHAFPGGANKEKPSTNGGQTVLRVSGMTVIAVLLTGTALSGSAIAQASAQPQDELKLCAQGQLSFGDNDNIATSAGTHVVFRANNKGDNMARVAVFTPQSPNEGGSSWVAVNDQHDWAFHVTSAAPVQWKFSVSELPMDQAHPPLMTYQVLSESCS